LTLLALDFGMLLLLLLRQCRHWRVPSEQSFDFDLLLLQHHLHHRHWHPLPVLLGLFVVAEQACQVLLLVVQFLVLRHQL
jgi:hypothetical protein